MMQTVLITLVLLTTLAVTGCDNKVSARAQQAQQAAFAQRETELVDDYYGEDIKKAEESLLALSQHYRDAQKDGTETTNYDSLLMLAHARLHLIYSHQRQTNAAAIQREEALKYMRHSAIYTGGGGKDARSDDDRWAELIETIDRLDKSREVKWKDLPAPLTPSS
jgi:hypothetical protein